MKIRAPMAAHYILNGTTCISSHEYSSLPLYKFLHLTVLEEEAEVLVKDLNGGYTVSALTYDYLYRPTELENICLYQFTESCSVNNASNRRFKMDSLRFLQEHPNFSSNHVSKRKIKVIPEIVRPRFPNRSKLEENSHTSELY